MGLSRRQFLQGSAALATAAAVVPLVEPQPAAAGAPRTDPGLASLPPIEVIALNRMAYGPRPGDLDRVRSMGLEAYVDEQLNPAAIDDSACDARIAAARLKISYAGTNDYPACNEVRPLNSLDQPISNLWYLTDYDTPMDWLERDRPLTELQVATWIRAVYSQRQLQEVLVDFWHNHFNVYAASEARISVPLPLYDRAVIRKHCLGNFRDFLGDVARSTAMLYYLDNVSNRVGSGAIGNENFTRELFEQHTLGLDYYLDLYFNNVGVGANEDGHAKGYVDTDVYHAARCFTGWTVANGDNNRPKTGEFYYDADWHDPDQKTVLSVDGSYTIPPNQGEQDGFDVLAMLARHRGTARNVCTKLCRRLIADDPPASVVDAAVAEWLAHVDSPDQIRRVVRVILLSNAFQSTWGQKMKRPFEAIISYLRATGAELSNDTMDVEGSYWNSILWEFQYTGQTLFEWPLPDGYPDSISYWANPNSLLRSWNLPFILTQNWGGNIQVDLLSQTNLSTSCSDIVDAWITRLCGFSINSATRQALIDFLAQGGDPSQPPQPLAEAPDWNDATAVQDRVLSMVQLLAASPDFYMR